MQQRLDQERRQLRWLGNGRPTTFGSTGGCIAAARTSAASCIPSCSHGDYITAARTSDVSRISFSYGGCIAAPRTSATSCGHGGCIAAARTSAAACRLIQCKTASSDASSAGK